MLCNEVVFCIILTQCEPEDTGLEQCDSGTCNFTSLNASFLVSIPETDCLEL